MRGEVARLESRPPPCTFVHGRCTVRAPDAFRAARPCTSPRSEVVEPEARGGNRSGGGAPPLSCVRTPSCLGDALRTSLRCCCRVAAAVRGRRWLRRRRALLRATPSTRRMPGWLPRNVAAVLHPRDQVAHRRRSGRRRRVHDGRCSRGRRSCRRRSFPEPGATLAGHHQERTRGLVCV